MMHYAGIIYNDFSSAPGVCLSFFTQGCPHKCHNCHNPETWDFDGGKEFTPKTMESIIKGLTANGVPRSLCILGGEPLCNENLMLTYLVINEVKKHLPDTKIYIWTGYKYEDLIKQDNYKISQILSQTDCLIDGPYIDSLRDITLPMRGSSNQRIIYLKDLIDGIQRIEG